VSPNAWNWRVGINGLGNGYIGIRSATEERYLRETRGVFVAGTFNKFDENEVTELPNAADMIAIELTIDGEPFDLTVGSMWNLTRISSPGGRK